MTEKEAFNDPEMKTILILSGYTREISEGADYEETTYKTAETIVKLFSLPVVRKSYFNRTSFLLGTATTSIIFTIVILLIKYVF